MLLVPCNPVDKCIVEAAVRVNNECAAFALVPLLDVLPEINRDNGNVFKMWLVPCNPVDKCIVEAAVRVNNECAAFALVPLLDVLPDEVFQHFGFSGASGTADV